MKSGRTNKIIKAKNFGLDLNLIRTHRGHGGENMDFGRTADTIGNRR